MRIDLQTHTTASDGVLSPATLVAMARAEGVDVVAVTDHDTMDGVPEAQAAGERLGVRVVAGVELSSTAIGREVHLLGLFCGAAPTVLRDEIEALRSARRSRAERMVERLRELGYPLTFADVLAQADGRVLARPHVARALVERGIVPDVRSAFTDELIGDGGRADVPRRELGSADAIRLIRLAGGVAVLAHAARSGVTDDVVADLARHGLAGLEADYPEHSNAERDRLRALARDLGLVVTGGSDFHVPGDRRIGQCTTAPDEFVRLEGLRS